MYGSMPYTSGPTHQIDRNRRSTIASADERPRACSHSVQSHRMLAVTRCSGDGRMDHVAKFESLISAMKLDGRYRTFIELERLAGEFPTALWHAPDGRSRRVTVWCSNDYLGMGQHPDVLAAMHRAIDLSGAGTGGTRNISGTNRQHVNFALELADPHGKDAALIFTSGWISN